MSIVANFGTWDRTWQTVSAQETFVDGSLVELEYKQDAVAYAPVIETVDAPPVRFDLLPLTQETAVPGTLKFDFAGDQFIDRVGSLYRSVDAQGAGLFAGTVDYSTGEIELTDYPAGPTQLSIITLLTRFGDWTVNRLRFRTPGAPIKPGSFYVQASTAAGDLIDATADFNGNVSAPLIEGTVESDTGVVRLWFGEYVQDSSLTPGEKQEPWYDPANVQGDGTIWRPTEIIPTTASFNCVVLQALPLDADLLGLDPVRLPGDGRVPIYQEAGVVVVHNTQAEPLPSPLSAGQQVTLPRGNLALVWLEDAQGDRVDPALYTVDRAAGTVTMATPLDLTGYTEPLVAQHRVEDMLLVSDVQIDGRLTVVGGVTRDYPANTSYVSSALIYGDLQSRVTGFFTQDAWDGSSWSDSQVGAGTTANYNDVQYPVQVDNRGAIKERWALNFTSSTGGNVIGETVGVIGTFGIATDVGPINPNTGTPYFLLQSEGFGSGWEPGNIIRFNTEAAAAPMWIARTILSGPATADNDSFRVQNRGDAD